MKYWVIGVTAALTLLAAGPVQHTQAASAAGPAYASIDGAATGSN